MSAGEIFWWVVLPYISFAIFIVGHIWRWRYDQFGWTSRSTQLQEKRLLKWGSPLFHYGTFAAIGGHILGILIPESWTEAVGIPESAWHWLSAVAGTVAAVLVIAGIIILAFRRNVFPRVRASTSAVDWLALIVLLVVVVLGVAPTVGINLLGSHYDYRPTVAVWFRSLFVLNPDVHLISHAPLIYQVHATAAWFIFAIWPFTRLVHAWSYPLFFLWRPFIVHRSRVAASPDEPGTGGRRWRRIGTGY